MHALSALSVITACESDDILETPVLRHFPAYMVVVLMVLDLCCWQYHGELLDFPSKYLGIWALGHDSTVSRHQHSLFIFDCHRCMYRCFVADQSSFMYRLRLPSGTSTDSRRIINKFIQDLTEVPGTLP